MSDYSCFLIWVLNGDSLLECALKVPNRMLAMDERDYPADFPEAFHALLPLHVRSCGPIVKIESIFEVHEVSV